MAGQAGQWRSPACALGTEGWVLGLPPVPTKRLGGEGQQRGPPALALTLLSVKLGRPPRPSLCCFPVVLTHGSQ